MSGKQSHSAMLCEKIRDGEKNPFWTIEAIQEHIGMVTGGIRALGVDFPSSREIGSNGYKPRGKHGDAIYHLDVITNYVQDVLNLCAALMPDLYLASDGDMKALERMKDALTRRAASHQREWDEMFPPKPNAADSGERGA